MNYVNYLFYLITIYSQLTFWGRLTIFIFKHKSKFDEIK